MCVCVCVCVRERERETIPKSFTASSAPGPTHSVRIHREYSTTARRAAVTRVRGGANLSCTSQLRAVFLHPCTAYRQLQFCVQSLLDRLCKHTKFQMRFRPDKPDHSLVGLPTLLIRRMSMRRLALFFSHKNVNIWAYLRSSNTEAAF
jgi:hypothetical protein